MHCQTEVAHDAIIKPQPINPNHGTTAGPAGHSRGVSPRHEWLCLTGRTTPDSALTDQPNCCCFIHCLCRYTPHNRLHTASVNVVVFPEPPTSGVRTDLSLAMYVSMTAASNLNSTDTWAAARQRNSTARCECMKPQREGSPRTRDQARALPCAQACSVPTTQQSANLTWCSTGDESIAAVCECRVTTWSMQDRLRVLQHGNH